MKSKWYRKLAVAGIGCSTMFGGVCPFIEALGNRIADVLNRDDDSFGSQLDGIAGRIEDLFND